jgi:phosphoglycerate dehydrogenase-like enzyme
MRLLIHDESYRRCREAIDTHKRALELLLIDHQGQIRLGDATLPPAEARPDAAWLNNDIFFSPGIRPFVAAMLGSPQLSWVQSGAAGYDAGIFQQIVQKGARLTTSHGQAVGIADYVLWGVLDVWQGGAGRRAGQAAAEWNRLPFREVSGSRWVMFGFGAIGQAVGVRARAFGAHVTGVRRNPAADPAADAIAHPSQLLELLPSTDVLVLAAPATAETRHVAGAEAFARMKPGSILVNVGRGALVDEAALVAALDAGGLDHAVLDVTDTEPLPAGSPLWNHPKVTLTPHVSGMSSGNTPRNDATFLDNLGRILAGEPLKNEVAREDVLAG